MSLLRSGRFFAHNFTPFKLTAWGFADCQSDPNAPGLGSTLGRLLLRTLPNDHTAHSVYTFFPFVTPDTMKIGLRRWKVLNQYDLARPTTRAPVKTVSAYREVGVILRDSNTFVTSYAARAANVINGRGFYTAAGPEAQFDSEMILINLLSAQVSIAARFFYDTTRKLIDLRSFALVGKKTYIVDIVRDVLRHVPVCWAASEIVCPSSMYCGSILVWNCAGRL